MGKINNKFTAEHEAAKQSKQVAIQNYLASIGRRGGRISKRTLSPQQAQQMVKIREARRAYRRFHAQCFWSYRPHLAISAADITWVAEQLMKHGGREAWCIGAKLCR